MSGIMQLASDALRSVLIAAPGCKLVVSDLSNIEGRMLAWLAGEQWKLDAFAAFDRGEGADLYKVAYGRSFGVDPATVQDDSDERQIGKVQELALGYQGGVSAYATMAMTYGVNLEEMAIKARAGIPRLALLDAVETWHWAARTRRTLGLSQDVYVTCEALKRLWRDAHPAIVALWKAVEDAAATAVMNPGGGPYHAGRLEFDRKGAWLRMRLPSGRYVLYPNPRLDDGGKISYASWNYYTKTWRQEPTYGGKLVENATQAASRDILAAAMLPAEVTGYPIVLTVHDELVTETPDDARFNADELSAILATNPPWAPGLPLAAKGFESLRYRKS